MNHVNRKQNLQIYRPSFSIVPLNNYELIWAELNKTSLAHRYFIPLLVALSYFSHVVSCCAVLSWLWNQGLTFHHMSAILCAFPSLRSRILTHFEYYHTIQHSTAQYYFTINIRTTQKLQILTLPSTLQDRLIPSFFMHLVEQP